MRHWVSGGAIAGLTTLLVVGCDSDSSFKGFSSVTITGEERESLPGNRCAVKGHATNTGNRRARVHIAWEARISGNTIATSTSDFEVAPFSNFDFGSSIQNSQGQPSSTAFLPPVSCSAIDDIRRTGLDVEAS